MIPTKSIYHFWDSGDINLVLCSFGLITSLISKTQVIIYNGNEVDVREKREISILGEFILYDTLEDIYMNQAINASIIIAL